ncbi:geraniol 8-hydroxylase-like [Dorcoceras hygrometricum]|uniref:Geraniol 8-hydroxylase-like n=1 Tax=Dorcoceras hygrometricum TaxID=472368 RepID=A0A2Z7D8L4_9LAMI|nr:geraniol 8-hydroxylase-like [Dorcoceras hygrometricum]
MELTVIIFLLLLSIILCTCFYVLSPAPRSIKGNLPPGPYRYPIIGNILDLGRNSHRSTAQLSKVYGPLMSLKLGNVTLMVITSPQLAKEALQKHDQSMYGRANPAVSEVHGHGKVSMIWLPTNDSRWRVLRGICKNHIFSRRRLDETEPLRQENLRKLRDYMQECYDSCGRVVNISSMAFSLSLNLLTSTLFSRDLSPLDSGPEATHDGVMEIVKALIKGVSTANVADYFPIFKFVDPQGIKRRAKAYVGKMFAILDDIISQRLQARWSLSMDSALSNDILDVLLDLSESDQLPQNQIKHLLMDLILAGTEATATTVEWTMAELIRNPTKMAKARHELQTLIGHDKQVQESDISSLPYLNAVVKESMRLHPIGPLLIPHKAETDVEMCGYLIPKNASVMVNVWAIGRDPSIWHDPERFEPERFFDRKIEFKGHDFELIPFGSGRRICPGMTLADRMVHLVVANMIHDFDWKLEGGMKPEELDLNENFTFSLHKAVPLKAIPIKL